MHSSESDLAALRGVPSLVWRAGQERRLALLNRVAPLAGKRVLVDGCGIGMYVRAIARYTPHVFGLDIEYDRVQEGRRAGLMGLCNAICERLPFPNASFDVVFSHEVLEHVQNDRAACLEMARVLQSGGRAAIFTPNRLYPFETHGVYWRGQYYFGNKPFVNWLPDGLRNRFAPHARAYTARRLLRLFDGAPVRPVLLTQVYPAFDNIVARFGLAGRALRAAVHALERSPLRVFGLSHLLVVEKT
ncbi:MAG: class I SAM-dependent methyltransferase [Anaerolineae bacterium]|nr:class I SAM-dependent methyltransferase [Thermoflexales bacterium]MDW8407745.1 class I SAM-dependent methyltransferase [Anaerolineae bacterium]